MEENCAQFTNIISTYINKIINLPLFKFSIEIFFLFNKLEIKIIKMMTVTNRKLLMVREFLLIITNIPTRNIDNNSIIFFVVTSNLVLIKDLFLMFSSMILA